MVRDRRHRAVRPDGNGRDRRAGRSPATAAATCGCRGSDARGHLTREIEILRLVSVFASRGAVILQRGKKGLEAGLH